MAVKLGLSETATDAEITAKLTAVMADSAKLAVLDTEVTKLKGDVSTLTTENQTLKAAAAEKQVTDLVDGAINGKKLAAGDRENYIKLAKADYETTKALIDGMKAYESVENRLSGGGDSASAELQELVKLSGRELYMQGKFEKLKALSAEQYKLKYKEYFGSEPK